jgi:DNA-binding NarL/FixJ family response regulator
MNSQDEHERSSGESACADEYAVPPCAPIRGRGAALWSFEVRLSPRERSVLSLISCGLSNKHIARELNIAPETVKSHTKHILVKMHAKNRAEAVARAAAWNLI